jgi:hypothetical protein
MTKIDTRERGAPRTPSSFGVIYFDKICCGSITAIRCGHETPCHPGLDPGSTQFYQTGEGVK